MKTSCALAFAVLTLGAVAEPGGVTDSGAGTYTITVEEGQTYELTADDATSASGLAFVKRGAGTAKAGAVMADFAGEIRIEQGFYWASDNGALGTSAGGTVVSNGGTLQVSYKTKEKLTFAGESITLAGTGADGKGALYHCSYNGTDTTSQLHLLDPDGTLSLSEDATIGGVFNLGFDGAELKLNGHTLTVAMSTDTTPFNLTFERIYNDGCIDIRRGRAFFNGSTAYKNGETGSVRVSGKSDLAFRTATKAIPYALTLADGARLYPSGGTGLGNAVNEWAGPITLEGAVDLSYNNSNATGVHFSGPISGCGSLEVKYGGILRLSNPGNTFTGGIKVSGIRNVGETLCGLYVDAAGAVPRNGPAITNDTSCVIFRGGSMTVPDIVCTTGGFISNAVPGSVVSLGAIEKQGAGDLTVSGGFALTNALAQSGGLVCLDGHKVKGEAGILYANTNFTSGTELNNWLDGQIGIKLSKSNGNTSADMRKVFALVRDVASVTNTVANPERAFSSWPEDEAFSLKTYWGCLRNNETTNVTYTIATSIADVIGVWIDDEYLFHCTGSKKGQRADGSSGTYFVMIGEVVLTPGAHKFDLLTGHFVTQTYGPKDSTSVLGVNWEKNFGLAIRKGGIDPSQPTNSTDYVALRNDSGWGTLLTTEAGPIAADLESEETACRYRPSFAALAFRKPDAASINTLDLGSFAFTTKTLAGVGRLTNGVVTVSGCWKAEADDFADGPLTVAAAASLNFASKCAFLSDDMRAFDIDLSGKPLALVEDGGSLTGVPVAAKGWKIRRVASELRLYCADGLLIILR